MSHKYKVGDEVWVKLNVIAVEPTDYTGVAPACVELYPASSIAWPRSSELRSTTELALNDAIVDAAVKWQRDYVSTNGPASSEGNHPTSFFLNVIYNAIQAKLDADKPKTAEDVVSAVLEDELGLDPLRSETKAATQAIVQSMRNTGLLNEKQ